MEEGKSKPTGRLKFQDSVSLWYGLQVQKNKAATRRKHGVCAGILDSLQEVGDVGFIFRE